MSHRDNMLLRSQAKALITKLAQAHIVQPSEELGEFFIGGSDDGSNSIDGSDDGLWGSIDWKEHVSDGLSERKPASTPSRAAVRRTLLQHARSGTSRGFSRTIAESLSRRRRRRRNQSRSQIRDQSRTL